MCLFHILRERAIAPVGGSYQTLILMVIKQTLFWGCWFTSLATTALLFFWSLPLSPFKHPGINANEAVIKILTGVWKPSSFSPGRKNDTVDFSPQYLH
ncbi:hypothetical protein CEN45_04740 [Fischerella thermalis CCMEE 5198]|nr:hypothetical protein CEN45_04740 [Fischerella thermalis CCMEE 5198]